MSTTGVSQPQHVAWPGHLNQVARHFSMSVPSIVMADLYTHIIGLSMCLKEFFVWSNVPVSKVNWQKDLNKHFLCFAMQAHESPMNQLHLCLVHHSCNKSTYHTAATQNMTRATSHGYDISTLCQIHLSVVNVIAYLQHKTIWSGHINYLWQ